MADTVGEQDIRGINVNKTVTGFALQEYVMKQLCAVQSSSSWQENYWREAKTELTGGTTDGTKYLHKGIPRLAGFPHAEVEWTKVESYHLKFGMEERISAEDISSNDIPALARTMLRIARGVTKAVDDYIWDIVTDGQAGTTTNNVDIAVGSEWDSATVSAQNPIQNILDAKKEIAIDNYNPDRNGYLVLNPKDYANLLGNANIRNAGQFYTDDVTRNGRVGFMLGLKVIVSNSVTADYAAVIIAKECANYKVLAPMRSVVIDDPMIGKTVRSGETGVCQLTNPEAVCLISNTAK